MENQERQKQAEEFFKTLIQKAWEDDNFKSELISNPKQVIGETFGKDLSSKLSNDKEVVVVDYTDDSKIYINIPKKVDMETLELSEEELELIAGGSYDDVMDFINKSGQGWGMMARDLYDWVTE